MYDCKKCPGYCCSYPIIGLDAPRRRAPRQAPRLSFEVCKRRHTRSAYGRKWIMRRKADPHFGRICKFFDTEKRRCTVYEGATRGLPLFPRQGPVRLLRLPDLRARAQEDPDFVAPTDSGSF